MEVRVEVMMVLGLLEVTLEVPFSQRWMTSDYEGNLDQRIGGQPGTLNVVGRTC